MGGEGGSFRDYRLSRWIRGHATTICELASLSHIYATRGLFLSRGEPSAAARGDMGRREEFSYSLSFAPPPRIYIVSRGYVGVSSASARRALNQTVMSFTRDQWGPSEREYITHSTHYYAELRNCRRSVPEKFESARVWDGKGVSSCGAVGELDDGCGLLRVAR